MTWQRGTETMSRTFKLVLTVITIDIFFGLYLGEVSLGDIKIGYFGSKTSDEMTYKYRLFNGIEQKVTIFNGKSDLADII